VIDIIRAVKKNKDLDTLKAREFLTSNPKILFMIVVVIWQLLDKINLKILFDKVIFIKTC